LGCGKGVIQKISSEKILESGLTGITTKIGRLLLDIEKTTYLSLDHYKEIDSLIGVHPEFHEGHADWFIKNHMTLLKLISNPNGKLILQQAFKEKSHISKIIKETKITRTTFYKTLNTLKNIELIENKEHIVGTAKQLDFNFQKHGLVLKAILQIIGQK